MASGEGFPHQTSQKAEGYFILPLAEGVELPIPKEWIDVQRVTETDGKENPTHVRTKHFDAWCGIPEIDEKAFLKQWTGVTMF